VVGRLTEALASDADSGVRRHATQALGSIDGLDAPALDQLGRALQDVCPDVRRNAALALRNAGAGSAVLVESLAAALRDPYSKTRRNAAQSLGKLGKAAIPATSALAIAAADENGDVRRRAIEALGLVGAAAAEADATDGSSSGLPDAVVTGVLGGAVLRDSDVVVRRVAALALMRLGKGARPAMAQLQEAATELATTVSVDENGENNKEANSLRKKLLGTVQSVLAKCVGVAG
jgi:HEAT repeat protein